jgi:hypothetical protein
VRCREREKREERERGREGITEMLLVFPAFKLVYGKPELFTTVP